MSLYRHPTYQKEARLPMSFWESVAVLYARWRTPLRPKCMARTADISIFDFPGTSRQITKEFEHLTTSSSSAT